MTLEEAAMKLADAMNELEREGYILHELDSWYQPDALMVQRASLGDARVRTVERIGDQWLVVPE